MALPAESPHTVNPLRLFASEETIVFGALLLFTISTNSSLVPLGPSNRNSEMIIPELPLVWARAVRVAEKQTLMTSAVSTAKLKRARERICNPPVSELKKWLDLTENKT